jgi:3-deoxy-D-manno-octulosonate 8-phosphate phosphatase (KDO 8-P phosphatase)
MASLEERARVIRLVCTDIDGVLTAGELHYGPAEGHTKSFHVRDGAAIKWLQACGIPVAFISGLESPATRERARHLAVEDCFAGTLAKGPALDSLCAKYNLSPTQVAHVGDDLPDLPLLQRVGLACCPQDAVLEVRQACHWVVPVDGGRGVLRALAELILKTQGRWQDVVTGYQS